MSKSLWVIDEDGWIENVVQYKGCGSHQAEWASEEVQALAKAAPQMYEALIDALDVIKIFETTGHSMPETVRFIELVLKKARGES